MQEGLNGRPPLSLLPSLHPAPVSTTLQADWLKKIAVWATMKVLSAPTEFDRLLSGGCLLGDSRVVPLLGACNSLHFRSAIRAASGLS